MDKQRDESYMADLVNIRYVNYLEQDEEEKKGKSRSSEWARKVMNRFMIPL